MTARPIAPNGR
jgi:hypothetical protein